MERVGWSRQGHRGRQRGMNVGCTVCVCVCGVYMHSMRSDRDRERGLREIET